MILQATNNWVIQTYKQPTITSHTSVFIKAVFQSFPAQAEVLWVSQPWCSLEMQGEENEEGGKLYFEYQ